MSQITLKSKTQVSGWKELISNLKIIMMPNIQRPKDQTQLKDKQILEKSKMMRKKQKHDWVDSDRITICLTEKRPSGKKLAHTYH